MVWQVTVTTGGSGGVTGAVSGAVGAGGGGGGSGGTCTGLAPKPSQILYGHSEPVTCVAISVELDLAVSGAQVCYNQVPL